MSLFMLDTNICIYAIAGGDAVLDRKMAERESGEVVVSMITKAELEVGFAQAADPHAARRSFQVLFADIPMLAFDDAAAARFGELQARAPSSRRGFDRLIAAHALSLGATLVTNNERDFREAAGLVVENWTKRSDPLRSPSA